ncbi:protein kinase, ATP binding site-containing protein [Tanacetum coccineum]
MGRLPLYDKGKPLIRVDSSGDHDSEDEVASVDNDMTKFLASKDVSYGTNSLLKQWKEPYGNGEYDYDPYNNDMQHFVMEIASQAQHPDESKKQSPQKSNLASGLNLEKLLIPLEEIKLATKNFDPENKIYKRVEFGVVYIGELSKRWKNRKAAFKCFIEDRGCSLYTLRQVKKGFLNELKFISSFNHERIIPFIGYCDEGDNMIIVYDYSENGSLHDYLNHQDKKSCLTWAQRLQICIDVAKGLDYLHSGLGERGKVIHGSVTDSKILLDDHLKGKICGFEFSALIPGNELRVYKPIEGKHSYIDPVYFATGFLKAQSDVYSFGALLFQIMNRPGSISDGWTTKAEGGHVIDPLTGDKISGRSFYMIKELAHNCITYSIKDRPTIDTIIKTVEEALYINDTTSITKESSEYQNPRNLIIPYEEIIQATRNVRVHPQDSQETIHIVPWKNRTAIINIYALDDHFETEFDIISRFHHPNIVSFIGYRRNTLVYEHPFNGRLVDHLQDPHKRHHLTWEQRLKICIGAARALKYLHSGLWEENRVVHRHFRSEIIFLDENMEAKICEFGKATLVPKNQSQVRVNLAKKGVDKDYEDPIYLETEIVNFEMDVYSFGVVMFEVLGGLKASERCNLIKRVYRDYDDGLEKLIDPCIKDQIDVRSLHTFAQAAYRCLSFNLNERPSMNRIIKRIEEALYFQNYRSASTSTSTTTIRSQQYQKLEDLIIPLNEINLATGNFNENSKIGKGGFGVVYKGKLSKRWPDLQVAIKRLNKTSHQAKTDFQNELELISRFHHQNIIHFIGYCEEGDEMLLVYEYAINGSLEDHLENPSKIGCLTWAQRLKICLGAAKGLDYLHTGLGEDYRVIHRDVKSGNILLDENLEAKICDFGFSKPDSAKTLQQSKLYTKVAGTKFYLDPIYHESGILRTESDVYSFGVVMLEMLSGMPAWRVKSFGHDKPQPLINLVRRYYDYGKDLLIDPQIKAQIDKSSFHTFIEIAYRCISFNSKERPAMETIADKIEEALDFQVKKDVSSNGD